MSLGFRVGVPGMRVRVSTRGVRASVGPRIARVSVGTGRTRVSSGLGPFYASTALGGSSRRRSSGPSLAAVQRQERAAARAQAEAERDATIRELQGLLDALVSVHRDTWPAATRPVVPLPPTPSLDWARKQATEAWTRGLGWTQRQEKKAAALAAAQAAERYVAAEQARARSWQAEAQAGADAWWQALLDGDEGTVCEALNLAFSDNPAGGVAVGFSAGTVSVVIRQPDLEQLPEQVPGVTAAGRPTLKRMLVRDRRALFLDSLESNVAATLRETFAVAPSVQRAVVVALSRSSRTRQVGPVLLGAWTRAATAAVAWGSAHDARSLVHDRVDGELQLDVSSSGEVKLLDPSKVPGLMDILDADADDGDDPDPDGDPRPQSTFAPRTMEQWWHDEQIAAQSAQQALLPALPTGRAVAAGQVITLTGAPVLTVDVHADGAAGDCDASVVLLDESKRARGDRDLVFYNAPVSLSGAVRVEPPRAAGPGRRFQRLTVDLTALPREGVTRCIVALSSDVPLGSQPLTALVYGAAEEPLQLPLPAESGVLAGVLLEVYLRDAGEGPLWRLRGVGQGWREGLAGLVTDYGIVVG